MSASKLPAGGAKLAAKTVYTRDSWEYDPSSFFFTGQARSDQSEQERTEVTPYRGSPAAIKVCVGIVSLLTLAILNYSGVFDEVLRALGSVGYEFLRALNSE